VTPLHLAYWNNQAICITLILRYMSHISRKIEEVFSGILLKLIEYNGFFEYIESLPFQTPIL